MNVIGNEEVKMNVNVDVNVHVKMKVRQAVRVNDESTKKAERLCGEQNRRDNI